MRRAFAGCLIVAIIVAGCSSDAIDPEVTDDPTIGAEEPTTGGGEPTTGDGELEGAGEVWAGTMRTETRVRGVPLSGGVTGSCDGSLDGTLQLVVAGDGTVTGEAPFTESETVCRGGGVEETSPGGPGAFSVSGTRSGAEFTLRFFLVQGSIGQFLPVNVLIDGVEIPVTGGDRAETEFSVDVPTGPATITGDFAFELTCENCAG